MSSKLPAQILQNALRFWRASLQSKLDEELEVAGWQTVFAIDASVIFAFQDITVSRDIHQSEQADLLIGDVGFGKSEASPLTSACYEQVLGDADTASLAATSGPLILLTGHSGEVKRQLSRSGAALRRSQSSSSARKIAVEKVIAELRKSRTSSAAEFDNAISELKIEEILFSEVYPSLRFEYICELLASRRVVSRASAAALELYSWADSGLSESWLLTPDRSKDEVEKILTKQDKLWLNEIMPSPAADGRSADYNALFDCLVLNRVAAAKKVRVVLITNNDWIIDSAERYQCKVIPEQEGKSFCDLFVRPMEYFSERILSEDRVLEQHWTEGLLAPFFREEIETLEQLSEHHPHLYKVVDLYRSISQKYGDLMKNETEWYLEQAASFSRSIANRKIWSEYGLSVFELKDAEDKEIVEALDAFFERILDKSREAFIPALAESGYALCFSNREEETSGSRSIPSVVFRSNITIGRDFEKLLSEYGASREWKLKLREFADANRKAVTAETGAGYMVLLMYSMLYAGDNDWASCNLLARQGIALAEKLGNSKGLTGREACYIAAISARLMAKSEDDLGQASFFLSEARAKLQQERQKFPELNGSRFDAEQLNIDISGILFRLFLNDERGDVLKSDVTVLLQRCEEALKKAEQCPIVDASVNSKISIRSSVFSLLVCYQKLRFDFPRAVDIPSLVEQQADDLVEYYSPNSSSDMPLRDLLLLATAAKLCKGVQELEIRNSWIFTTKRLTDRIDAACIMQFDKKRFSYCLSLLEK